MLAILSETLERPQASLTIRPAGSPTSRVAMPKPAGPSRARPWRSRDLGYVDVDDPHGLLFELSKTESLQYGRVLEHAVSFQPRADPRGRQTRR
jgi:hypothetical protein